MIRAAFALIIVASLLLGFVTYANSQYSGITRQNSSYTVLVSSWERYKKDFINPDGRVVDHEQKNPVTTSEAQSYALLRAVWVDDKPTFDLVWKWTQENLKRPNDHLLGWRWGLRSDGSYGFMPDGGNNAAADADADVALALILAGRRWGDFAYINQSKPIIADLWNTETASANGRRYEIAGNWANMPDHLVVNPSYFAPYAWRIFANIDKEHDWNSLVTPAYALLTQAGKAPLDGATGVGLPPDWMSVAKTNGNLSAADLPSLTTNYSFDAIRTPWRVALDYQWNKDPQALAYLKNSYNTLAAQYQDHGTLAQTYKHDGSVVQAAESPAMYATAIGYFMYANPDLAKKIYDTKILQLYQNSANSFDPKLPYYDQNWLWFAEGLYNHRFQEFTR